MKKIPVMLIIGASAAVLTAVAVWYFVIRPKQLAGAKVAADATEAGNNAVATGLVAAANETGMLNPVDDTTTTPPPASVGGVEEAPAPENLEMYAIAGPQYSYSGQINTAGSFQSDQTQLNIQVKALAANGRVILYDLAQAGGESPHYHINDDEFLDSIDNFLWNPAVPLTVTLYRKNGGGQYDWHTQSGYRAQSIIKFSTNSNN